MGTRSITVVYDEQERPLVTMYRQFDGYIAGHGRDLAEFLDGRSLVNGIGSNTPEKASNGMGCLAASLIDYFKDDIGNIYLLSSPDEDWGQEYIYKVYSEKVTVEHPYSEKVLFDGPWSMYVDYAKESDE